MAEGTRVNRYGADERNIARLSPVLCSNRVDPALVSWQKNVQFDSMGFISVVCMSGRGHVVPHGIDGDVMFALTAQYVLQGKPDNGFIKVSVAELCATLGLKEGGSTFERIRESVSRLRHVSYKVTDGWGTPDRRGQMRWRTSSFGIVNSLEETQPETRGDVPIGQYTATTLLQIGLSPELIASIMAGHIRNIDLNFYGQLEQPLTRLLYRTLEEMRSNIPEGAVFILPVTSWGAHLGMRALVKQPNGTPLTLKIDDADVMVTQVHIPAKIRRALEPAHTELLARGYLKRVEYVGRGQQQAVHYTFGTPTTPVDLELVALLTQRGVTQKVAEARVREHGRESVTLAAATFDARLAAGYSPRNRGGFLIDLLSAPDKYLTPQDETARDVAAPRSRTLNAAVQTVADSLPVLDTDALRSSNSYWIKQWVAKGLLNRDQAEDLERRNQHGELDVPSLSRLATTAGTALIENIQALLKQG
ncbi:replication initiator protein A [Deinococcus sp. SM5_A1]|uniref:replication initiator protein A n=1 Tax=Deinococcus sp. SM5_A1 TaxID=3379094 RepID=UPI00385FD9A1